MTFRKSALMLAVLPAILTVTPANAMNCGAVLDEITKAISGHLTMSPEKKAAMLRAAMNGYDNCSAGDTQSAAQTREMLMTQLKQNLGAPR